MKRTSGWATQCSEEGGLFLQLRNCDQMRKTKANWQALESAGSSCAVSLSRTLKCFAAAGAPRAMPDHGNETSSI